MWPLGGWANGGQRQGEEQKSWPFFHRFGLIKCDSMSVSRAGRMEHTKKTHSKLNGRNSVQVFLSLSFSLPGINAGLTKSNRRGHLELSIQYICLIALSNRHMHTRTHSFICGKRARFKTFLIILIVIEWNSVCQPACVIHIIHTALGLLIYIPQIIRRFFTCDVFQPNCSHCVRFFPPPMLCQADTL